MRVSDYIVEFLISKGITDVFGYPGGMVTYLMDSFSKYSDKINAHVNYHEQASAFAACSYAQVSGKFGVAYATSGPGAINMLTGVANAYFDSIPVIFITGQVNTYESKGDLPVRQRGFQETDIVLLAKSITKYAKQIINEKDIPYELQKAYFECMSGRKGPVLLDIPMNILRGEIIEERCPKYVEKEKKNDSLEIGDFVDALNSSKKPVIIAGRGIRISDAIWDFRELIHKIKIPVVTSMIAVDSLPSEEEYNFGFIGAYGHRFANFIVQNSDLLISLGSRLDCRQTGNQLEDFAPKAKLIRVDIDSNELFHKIKEDEVQICVDIKEFIQKWKESCTCIKKYENWYNICSQIKERLAHMDDMDSNIYTQELENIIPDSAVITTDVGQNQVWIAQSLRIKENTQVLFSGGLGAMGYSLPAAIGAYYACKDCNKTIISINGDGGMQMNIQELQFILRERLPIKIIIYNNKSLGMIRHFQEMYFESNYVQTKESGGYKAVNFQKIAAAYEILYKKIRCPEDVKTCKEIFLNDKALILEIELSDSTYVYPKLAMGHPIHDQDKLMERELFDELMELCDNV